METNNLADVGISHAATTRVTLDWDDPDLAEIIRIRFVGDTWRGLFDLSYALGLDRSGQQVHVRIPTYQVVGGRNIRSALYRDARHDAVYLNRLCTNQSLDDVLSICY